jgi:hypothetical protein
MFKNTFQSGFLSILYSIGACRPAAAPAQRGGRATANGSSLPASASLGWLPPRALARLRTVLTTCVTLHSCTLRLQAAADLEGGGQQRPLQADHR